MLSMPEEKIVAKYRIETCLELEKVAETIAGEQSSGTFLPVPGETEELKARSRAKVAEIKVTGEVSEPSLRGGRLRVFRERFQARSLCMPMINQ